MGWNQSFTIKSIGFVFIVLLALHFSFPGKLYGLEWLMAAFIIFTFVFLGIQSFNNRWENITEKSFITRLFWFSFGFRVAAMLLLLLISYSTWDMFYYVGAKDEMKYFRVASEASDVFSMFGLSEAYKHILENYRNEISDTGFCAFQTVLIIIIGSSPIIFKLIYITIGSFTVIRLYKLTTLVFDQRVARLSAIIFMLFPIAWFYSIVLMKESLMILLILEAIIQILKLQKQLNLNTLLKLLLLVVLLFFFRSAISILMVLVAAFSMFLLTKKNRLLVNIVVTIVLLGAYLYFLQSTGKADDYYEQYTETDEFESRRVETGTKINPYFAVANAPVYVSISLFAPFPSFVKVPIDSGLPHNEYYYHIAGCLTWIILAFFSIVGLYHAIRYRRQELAPIWAFILGYQFILLKAILFTSVRFSYPAKPLLIIMAAYGIYKLKNKYIFNLYLGAALLMIIGWNYVRLTGRGG